MDSFDWKILGVICGLLLLVFIIAGICQSQENRLLKQCMDDGHKEYECHSMLDSHSSTTYMPMYFHN